MKTIIQKEFHVSREEVYKLVQLHIIKNAKSPDYELIDKTNIHYRMEVNEQDDDSFIVLYAEPFVSGKMPGHSEE